MDGLHRTRHDDPATERDAVLAQRAAERWAIDHPEGTTGCRCPKCVEDDAWELCPGDDAVFADDEDVAAYLEAMEQWATTLDVESVTVWRGEAA